VGLLALSRSMSPLVPPLALTVLLAAGRGMILPATDFRYGLWIVAGSMLVLLETVDALGGLKLSRLIHRAYTPPGWSCPNELKLDSRGG
jgi:hypothetical protein